MYLILIILLIVLVGGGGFGYYNGWHASSPGPFYGGSVLGVVLVVALILFLLGRF